MPTIVLKQNVNSDHWGGPPEAAKIIPELASVYQDKLKSKLDRKYANENLVFTILTTEIYVDAGPRCQGPLINMMVNEGDKLFEEIRLFAQETAEDIWNDFAIDKLG